MKMGIIIGVFVAIVVAASLFVFTKTGMTPTSSNETTSSISGSNTQESSLLPTNSDGDVANSAVTIVVKENGFSPADIKVKVGDIIAVRNDSSDSVQFSSDPHPVHSDNQELNQRTIKPGATQTFKVTVKGTFGFHDHLNSSLSGTVEVE